MALKDYTSQQKAGIKEPVFKASLMKDQAGVAAWGNEEQFFKETANAASNLSQK